ncbi:uncharacterized protein LOC134234186 [Saccostrea cucullata]|uniref:uncharacterized protein LOC134234186 n=1 Tax=Saccostrea cuccullata TaxID=36930 RepID=UPI002ED47269
MTCMFLIFFTIVWPILYTYVYGEEIESIQGVAEIYSRLANGSTCFNSSSLDDFEQDVKKNCKWSDGKEDNYFIFQINYAGNTFLYLRNKKNSTCNYNKIDVIIECNMNEKAIEPIKSCIVDQCLNKQRPGMMKDNETEKLVITSKETTENLGIIAAVVEGVIIIITIVIFTLVKSRKSKATIGCQKSCIERCCSVSSLTSTRHRRENASRTSSQPAEMAVYEAIPDKNVYDHLHEEPKTIPKPGRYSTMKEIREIRQAKTDESYQPVDEEKVTVCVKNDDKNENNTFQILQQSAEGDDGKTNLDEKQPMGEYFVLEKKCSEEKDVTN